ncbi:hypothetical protein LXA43DRAFT_575930 [Ganoderma leucocontextum]|nr:hypothetical protein LXA43DRAFT_575930 [Ganoderma leucocontextum]
MNLVPLRLEQVSTDLFIITQTNYDCGQPFPTTAVSQPCAYSQFRLLSANAKDFDALSSPNEVAFPNVTFGQKISFRLRVVGRPPYDRQVNIPRAGRSKSSPARATLATLMAKEIKQFVDHERENRRPLMHLGRAITLDDLCLVEIRHVSRASIQPVIGLVTSL